MGFCSALGATLLEYDTLKVVHIRSKKVGIINRLIQAVICGYILGYAIIYKKGYQETEQVTGAVTAKLKGVGYTNKELPGFDDRVWDAADYHIPPQQSNAFYVMTNMIITPNQVNGTCPESPATMSCKSHSDCEAGEAVPAGNGIMTGKCVSAGNNDSIGHNGTETKSCEIVSWCPVASDTNYNVSVMGHYVRNFTVLLKNYIVFRQFRVKRRNIGNFEDPKYLKKCRFDPYDHVNKGCPIMQLDKIFQWAGVEDEWHNASLYGAVMAIDIIWDCNLDLGVKHCNPEYQFRRVDDPNSAISPGFNFRYAQYFEKTINGSQVQARNLTKSYGILFVVNVRGTAGRFSIVPLLINLGSGLALLGVATILCDFVALHLLSKRHIYQEKKFEHVDVEDDLLDDNTPLLRAVQVPTTRKMEKPA